MIILNQSFGDTLNIFQGFFLIISGVREDTCFEKKSGISRKLQILRNEQSFININLFLFQIKVSPIIENSTLNEFCSIFAYTYKKIPLKKSTRSYLR